ncbi:MAG: hypothetical protein V4760_11290 [Bdellovibrionota bacterium]
MRLLLVALTFFSTLASAADGSDSRSVGWQKVMLEQTLQDRVRGVVSAFSKEDFVARVDIVASRLRSRQRGVATESLSLGKLDMLAPAPPKDVSNSDDIFSYMERVNVTVTLKKEVLDSQKAAIEKAIVASLSPVTQTAVAVSLEAFPEMTVTKEVEKPKERTWVETFEQNALPFAMLAAALLLAGSFVSFLGVYRRTETKKIEALAKQEAFRASAVEPERGRRSETDDDDRPEARSTTQPMSIDANLSQQIRSITATYPQKVPTLVRRWLSSDSDKCNEALWILPKLLPLDAMVHLAAQLDEDSKREWRSVLEQPSPAWNEVRAQEFVAFELIDDVLRQSFPLADDLRQLLDGVKTDEVAELAMRDPMQGALLINILSTAQSARVLTLLPTDIRTQVIRHCPSIELEDVTRMTPILRQELMKLRRKSDVVAVPFTDRALELVREVGPELENDIFDSLAKALPQAELRKALASVCPADVILAANSGFHRRCLTQMPLSQRAELIYSSPESRKAVLLAVYPAKEKVRELMEAEISMIEADAPRAAKARREADRTWRTYIQICRRLVQSDELVAESLRPALERWVETRAQGEKRDAA